VEFQQQVNAALRILQGIEEGSMSAADSAQLVEDADPALVYLLFTWLRHRYPASDPASEGVLGRLVAVSNRGSVAGKMKDGAKDPVVQWFEDDYSYRDLGSRDFVALIVEKLEG
jgi:hypothetical protein